MTPNVERLLDLALQLPASERLEFVAHECSDPAVCAEVQALLQDAQDAESLLDAAVRDASVSLRATEEFAPGDGIGPYRIVSLIERGGMGTVYLAERADGTFDQRVAVKVVQVGSTDLPLDRFEQERRILGILDHPNIARILDGGQTRNGLPYFVMEYVPGQAIDRFCENLNLGLQKRLELFLKVCHAVGHAHQNLIVHRDLKPVNIVVTEGGEPKLLDFGIAKILDPRHIDSTSTRVLTPAYASPEQIRGDRITTATDVYSLGAVLYKILTGRFPREPNRETPTAAGVLLGTSEIPAPSALNFKLPNDIDHLLGKALRDEPEERYVSVEALANDIRAFLDWQPIKARSDDAWYRTRKFLRRNRVAMIAATVVMASLSLGLYTANRERAIAQRRFSQVRQLSNKVLTLDPVIGGLHSFTAARHEIVAMSKEYLEALGGEADLDQDLALEISEAYTLMARAEGVSVVANLGRYAQAEDSLLKAARFVEPVLNSDPRNRKALVISARISHDRMILAETSQRNEEALVQARRAITRLDQLFALGALSEAEIAAAAESFGEIAIAHKNAHRLDEAIVYANRSVEISRMLPDPHLSLSFGLSALADILRLSGDLDGALQAITKARSHLDNAHFPSEMARHSLWFNVLWREAKILGATSGISLNRPDEAIVVLRRLFDLVEQWAQNDPNDAWGRLFFVGVGRELGELLRLRNPHEALGVYDHALHRLDEIKDNTEARRGEVEVLAGSAYALRRLGRTNEAKDRIDAAFRLLKETKDYPADSISPDDGAAATLRALGDHLAETGHLRHAVCVYEELLEKIMAARPDPQNDLRHASVLSQIYASLEDLYRRTGQRHDWEAMSARRRELWRHWDDRLPQNDLIRRQFYVGGSRKAATVLDAE